jgi:hypothetical protein
MHILHSTTERLPQSLYKSWTCSTSPAGVRVEGVSQRKPTGRRRVPIVASIDLQLQVAIIAHSKEIEVAFSQTNEGRRRSKIATLWELVCDGRLLLQAIPVFVVILGVVFAELACDVETVRYLVDDLRRSLEHTARVLPISPVRDVPVFVVEVRILSYSP